MNSTMVREIRGGKNKYKIIL